MNETMNRLQRALTWLRHEMGNMSLPHLEALIVIAENEYEMTRPELNKLLNLRPLGADRLVARLGNATNAKGNGYYVTGFRLVEVSPPGEYVYTPGYAGKPPATLYLTQKGWRVYNKLREIMEGES